MQNNYYLNLLYKEIKNSKWISWQVVTHNNEIVEKGEYKVWKFEDFIGKENIDVPDGYNIEHVNKLLDKIRNKYRPIIIVEDKNQKKAFQELSGTGWTESSIIVRDLIDSHPNLRELRNKSLNQVFNKLGGSMNSSLEQRELYQLAFVFKKLSIYNSSFGSSSGTNHPMMQSHQHNIETSNINLNNTVKDKIDSGTTFNWIGFVIGIAVFGIGVGVLVDGGKNNIVLGSVLALIGPILISQSLNKKK